VGSGAFEINAEFLYRKGDPLGYQFWYKKAGKN
jgi:hypothetical protein